MSDRLHLHDDNPDISKLEYALSRLNEALLAEQSRSRLLQLWSWFVRVRDGHRCIRCGSSKSAAAHHICRKTFLPIAQYQTGNGITLCTGCHSEVHRGFNGRPDLDLPMDAQGGEKIDTMERLYGMLLESAVRHGLLGDDFYHLSDDVLARFKMFQGFEPDVDFPGSRLEQASQIWRHCPKGILDAVLSANGFDSLSEPLPPGSILLEMEE